MFVFKVLVTEISFCCGWQSVQRLTLIKVLRTIDCQCSALNGSSLSILLPRLREQSERGDRKNVRAKKNCCLPDARWLSHSYTHAKKMRSRQSKSQHKWEKNSLCLTSYRGAIDSWWLQGIRLLWECAHCYLAHALVNGPTFVQTWLGLA